MTDEPPSKTIGFAKLAIGIVLSVFIFAAAYKQLFGESPSFVVETIGAIVSISGLVTARNVMVDGYFRRQTTAVSAVSTVSQAEGISMGERLPPPKEGP